jgi:hypothetical protein
LPVAPAIPSLFSTMFDFLFCVLFVHTVIYSARNGFILAVYVILLKKKNVAGIKNPQQFVKPMNNLSNLQPTDMMHLLLNDRLTQ